MSTNNKAKEKLQKLLLIGSTVNTIQIHAAEKRKVYAVIAIVDGKVENISNEVSRVVGLRWCNIRDGVWAESPSDIVQSLSFALHGQIVNCKGPDGYEVTAGFTLKHRVL